MNVLLSLDFIYHLFLTQQPHHHSYCPFPLINWIFRLDLLTPRLSVSSHLFFSFLIIFLLTKVFLIRSFFISPFLLVPVLMLLLQLFLSVQASQFYPVCIHRFVDLIFLKPFIHCKFEESTSRFESSFLEVFVPLSPFLSSSNLITSFSDL